MPSISIHVVGKVILQILEPLLAVPPAEQILTFAIRSSMRSPQSHYTIFGTNNQE